MITSFLSELTVQKFHLILSFLKKMKIKRKIDNFSLFDYKISKQDVLNSIISRNEGVYCTEFYDKNYDAVEIVLKNKSKDSENYIYSKDNKALIPLSAVSGNELREDFKVIAHKNNLYFLKIYK